MHASDLATRLSAHSAPTHSHRSMKEGGAVSTHRIGDRLYVSNVTSPVDNLEYAASLISHMLDRAIQDLSSESQILRMDAYFWLTSRFSDLYQHYAPMFGIKLSPGLFRNKILAAGMPDYPEDGIQYMTIDTDDNMSWSYSPHGESRDVYRAKLARLLTENNEIAGIIECAVLSGVQLKFHGQKADTCEAAVKTLLACKAENRHQKTTRMAIEGVRI